MDVSTFTLENFSGQEFQAVCFLGSSLSDFSSLKEFEGQVDRLKLRQEHDAGSKAELIVDVHNEKLVLFKSVGDLQKDYEDPRVFFEAGKALLSRAISAEKKDVLFIVNVADQVKLNRKNNWGLESEFSEYKSTSVLGALEATYVNLEKRERPEWKGQKTNIFTIGLSAEELNKCAILEQASVVARDLGGSDPERMAPPRMAEYSEKLFADVDSVKMKVISDQDEIAREFPAFQCVNRATKNVPRHHGRIIVLEYRGEAPKEHLCLVGKGVTYDTGGADVKAGGIMAGMHRDKCGACNAIGLMYAIGKLKPQNLNLTVIACCIRNSIGSECYVADEIFKSRGGKYVRVCNTDAEGRMAMVDLLCLAKERAISEKWINPHLFTVATLTGHACLAFDEAYTAVMDNGPAAAKNTARKMQINGHLVADPCEISTIRREDYKASTATDGYADCLQCGMAASSRTPRGHQQPAAFMILASGLDAHGLHSEQPIAYTHCDIAPSAGPYPGLCTGAPIRCFVKSFAE